MTVAYRPYNPQADPKQYFAQGFENLMAGLNQRRESERFGQALGGVDPEAGLMQIISQLLTGGATPQQAMGMGSMMQKGGAGRLGTLPGWWAFATPKQQQAYMDRVGGPLVQVGEKLLTPEQRQAKAEKDFKDAMEQKEDTPLSVPQLEGYGEQMNTRLDKSKRVWYKRAGRDNYPESELFKQWQIFASMHKFKNDTQKEQIWNMWQNKIKNRAAEGWFGKETDFDPTDPKWRKAMGLSREEETSDDARYKTIPPPMQNRITGWMEFSEEVRKQIWQAYENGWDPNEILNSLKVK